MQTLDSAGRRSRAPAQELMLILEEFWKRTPALHNVPIYTMSGIAARALGIYQTYIEMMGEDIRQAFQAVRVRPAEQP